MKPFKKIISLLSDLIKLLILIYILCYAPMIKGYKPIAITTPDMEPSYKKGSISYYKKVLEKELKVGDVITFKRNNKELVTRRITSIDNGFYLTRTDTGKDLDTIKVLYQDIEGKNVKIIVRYIGYGIDIINRYIIIFILTSIVIIIGNYLLNPKEKKNKKKDNDIEEEPIEII